MHAARTRSIKLISVLRTYRHIREQLADEWIEERLLPYLARCRYPGLQDLFPAFRRKKKIVDVLSDYPADAKLAAPGLSADLVISGRGDRVRLLKPHPRGLLVLLADAGVKPQSALLIGDRLERDGFAARRTGLRALIRSAKPIGGWHTFASYGGPMFGTFWGLADYASSYSRFVCAKLAPSFRHPLLSWKASG